MTNALCPWAAEHCEVGGREGDADNGGDKHSREGDEADGLTAFAARAGGEYERQHADKEAPCRHHDRAEPRLRAAYRGTRTRANAAVERPFLWRPHDVALSFLQSLSWAKDNTDSYYITSAALPSKAQTAQNTPKTAENASAEF